MLNNLINSVVPTNSIILAPMTPFMGILIWFPQLITIYYLYPNGKGSDGVKTLDDTLHLCSQSIKYA